MKVSMLWYGGANYAPPMPEDLERFDSLRELTDELHSRRRDPYYPCAYEPTHYDPDGRLTIAHIYRGHDPLDADAYPDAVASIGPRGGIRIDPA